MLNNTIKYIIRKHFEDKELCFDLLKTFQDTLEEQYANNGKIYIFTNYGKKLHPNVFTAQYHSIVGYKTSHYSFFLPVTVAMHFAGINNVDKLRQAEAILSNVGFLFNVQDDYMACFEESKVIGKDNTDIQKGKCTWLVATAFDYATPVQRNILKECYGSSDPEKVKRVKQLFIDLELPDRYSIFEDEMYNLQNVLLQKLSPGPLHKFFSDLLGKLYRRSV
ncbi:farnesyl pyrophosphate synthase-like [Pogonomyrmex barbatus]|uniref:Farnesyl pyrophosphate synthase-like n=1 Tax=Pogonomyrmex barbatus TaxID=144034 RepID=A0A6I9XEH4_9HYME|nr:farnesyl pyrophosphate synthase-like [Pogonomyrmex barbatus]XP_025075156.1 farnesyl pyrophosphate synthase-like [Pogonomyrmex barbatus]XP_025075157.1 farnesyl pyrophosphate synthase-like [Pogonomyrmex barbatus]